LIAQIYNINLHAAPTARGRCLRDDRDSGTGLDHLADGIEAGHARPHIHRGTEAGSMPG
jgi:hypothetical protein